MLPKSVVRPDENDLGRVVGRDEVEVAHLLAARVDHGEPVTRGQLDGGTALGGDPGPTLGGGIGVARVGRGLTGAGEPRAGRVHRCSAAGTASGSGSNGGVQSGGTARPAYCRASDDVPWSLTIGLSEPCRSASRRRIVSRIRW